MKPEALLFFYAEMMMMMTENLRISCNLQQWLYAWEPSSAFTTTASLHTPRKGEELKWQGLLLCTIS